ncbi:MBL fold metallo-hydrolase [Lipingzhangella sp. LS1_29]|uniref:MBL fold metallo-hydrolase n=1 Tax=Lipingzhangella rawalii TaxID=2055835 RepID=A0ABU2HBC7_9ACTN|nr:MBL fold metallo-hydrolase [Lipingzhangella rawalii]MDS1272120.1 MBL fold metallo-hydrolase [Lipingzhangella rawalii]
MRLTVIGCSGSFPGPTSPASCYLVEAGGFRLLLDLGNGALGALQRHVDMYEIDAVYLSHLHADHCLDVCSYWVARTYAPDGAKPRIPVYGPVGVAEHLARAYGMSEDPGMTDTFEFRELTPGAVDIGPFRAEVGVMNHPVLAYAIRLEYGGKSLTYSGDTAPCTELRRLAHNTDLFLCEASFHDHGERPENVHLTGVEAGEHAHASNVGHLVLTHLVPWNDNARILREAQSAFPGPTELARPGASYQVGALRTGSVPDGQHRR